MRANDNGAPVAVRKSGRWLAVACVVNRHQTEDRWWTEQPVSRDYYDVLLEGEHLVSVFHDLIGDRWWEQRYG
ncbi:MAG: hypothetical protein WBD55_01505 [Dehalococcoidia bacterium]